VTQMQSGGGGGGFIDKRLNISRCCGVRTKRNSVQEEEGSVTFTHDGNRENRGTVGGMQEVARALQQS
jgi:hypothetical protein